MGNVGTPATNGNSEGVKTYNPEDFGNGLSNEQLVQLVKDRKAGKAKINW